MRHSHRQRGFTIIELMISTAVFSLILLVILTAVTQIGRMYYKGITTARTQETARVLLDTISQQIQFSSSVPSPPAGPAVTVDGVPRILCINTTRIVFLMNRQVTNESVVLGQSRHGVWIDQGGGTGPACTIGTVNMSNEAPSTLLGGYELLPQGTRLLALNVQPLDPLNSLWRVSVRVAFGDQDLLEAPNGDVLDAFNFATAVCKGSQIGTQFCAVSELETTVLRRVTL